ncbi:MAG: IgGFc-binding protein [Flavobacteriaceae bacterium]|jgi:hypothetical protein|nr:IgGFc-binding protein [Flavobacteriaceae bacterium]
MNTLKKTVITAMFFTLLSGAYAQMVGTPYIPPSDICTTNTEGTEFWVSFGRNYTNTADVVYLQLDIAAEAGTTVTLNFRADNSSTTYTVASATVLKIDLSNVQGSTPLGDKRAVVYLNPTGGAGLVGVSSNTLKITSSRPISVYAFSACGDNNSVDATIVLPVNGWGTEYYRLSYAPNPTIILPRPQNSDVEIIIARENNTILTIPPTTTFTLAAGEAFYYYQNSEMIGRHITSNKPVAYFTHNTLSFVPFDRSAGDILFEQLQPVSRWGTKFLVPNAPQGGNSLKNTIRIIAAENGTTVNYSGATVQTTYAYGGGPANPIPGAVNLPNGGTLNAGQFAELSINSTGTGENCYISASKPMAVAAYMVGIGDGGPSINSLGDPSIAWIPPLNQVVSSVTIAPFLFLPNSNPSSLDFFSAVHYMLIIAKTSNKAQTTVNGTPIGTAGWTDNTPSGFSYYLWTFATPQSATDLGDLDKIFTVANPNGIIVLCGGLASGESYYYYAGGGLCGIDP